MTQENRLTKKEVEFLERLVAKYDTLRGKKQLRQVIYYNTFKAKYKVDDYVRFNRRDMCIYGKRVIDFVGRVTRVTPCYGGGSNDAKTIQYDLEVTCKVDDTKDYVTEAFTSEYAIIGKTTRKVNYITTDKTKKVYSESLDITF